MIETNTITKDPYAKLPGNSEIEVQADKINESEKAFRVRLPDGREFWVPKSVGRMRRFNIDEHGRDIRCFGGHASNYYSDMHSRGYLTIPLWFWRKQNAA